jgi:glutamate synthase (NADPH/NADH) small chain
MGLKDVLMPFKAWGHLAKKPVPLPKAEIYREAAPRYRGFHTNDVNECIGCGTCEAICENKAIVMVEVPGIEAKNGDSGLRPMIDYGRCCWCAFCVDVCTTHSLSLTNEYIWVDDDADNFQYVPGVDKKPWDDKKDGWHKPGPNYDLYPTKRVEMEELTPEERDHSFIEIVKGYSKEQAKLEADRCVECGICINTCPAHMGIPEYIKAIRDDDIEHGLKVLYDTNPLPEICGRICTHKCEDVCSVGHHGDPLSIRWLKRYIADQVPSDQYHEILDTKEIYKGDKKIALVGSGPASLSAAYYLSLMGHNCTIFEKLEKAGGMMRYGIPEYRLPYDQIDKDINYIESLGVEIKYNTPVDDTMFKKLSEEYDAVFIGTGLHLGRSTRVPGSDHPHVFQSIDLLREITEGKEIMVPEKVVIIGGGNVAMDITRSMARLQKIKYGKVQIITTSLESEEEMPADREEVIEAREEGATINPGWGPKEIEIVDGKIKGLHVVKVLSVFDEDHRFNPKFDENEKNFFEGDMVVESIGQGADMTYLPEDIKSKMEFNQRGRIIINDYHQTSIDWLFVGGDMVVGPDVIHGIANGHKAAIGIDHYLKNKK